MRLARTAAILIVVAAAACGVGEPTQHAVVPARIVSMAPSLTETLIALGLGDRVVGVTRYCPPVPGAVSVGGYFDPSFETIVSLDPDLVIVMQSHDELRRRLAELGLATLRVDQHDIGGILASVKTIAARCWVADRGVELADDLRAELDGVAAAVAGRPRPRVLVAVGRQPGDGVRSLWAAARDTFYDDVLRLAGGVNALSEVGIRYPELSREGLIAVDPDVILDVIADGGARSLTPEVVLADWAELTGLRAVSSGNVHVLADDYIVIPGPRIVDTVRRVAELLHPGAVRP